MKALPLLILVIAVACTKPSNQDEAIKADSTESQQTTETTDANAPAGMRMSNPSITHHYTGVIGGKYKFLMNLSFDADSIEGEYRYYTQQGFITVKGVIDETSRKFSAEESLYDYSKQVTNITGYFEGVQNGDSVKGTWTSADKKKTFPFVLATDEKEMPAFNIYDNGKVDGDFQSADTIVIHYGDKASQVITGFTSDIWKDVSLVRMEDLNFDGYLDILIPEFTGAKNTPFLYWIYEPESGEFISHPELEATDPIIDLQHKQIISHWSGSAISSGTDKYVFQDGSFYLIEREETDWEKEKTSTTKYKIVDGKSVEL
jgi:hypothetical protein